MRTIRTILVAMMLVAFGLVSVAMAGPTKTAQGIWVNLQAGGDFALVQNNVYKFNYTTASGYFTNQWNGIAPTVSCTGPGCGTAPTAPTAPLPDATQVTGTNNNGGVCKTNECTFFNGGTLTGSTYTQTMQVSTGSGGSHATYTYTYTYNVTPTTTDPVAALTAWDLVNTTGSTTATITIDAAIAGESVVVSNQFPCVSNQPGTAACGKFSFNLENGGVSRVQNLAVTVTDSSNNTVYSNSSIPFTIIPCDDVSTPCSGPLTGFTFGYTTNAGSNGAISYLQNGSAYKIMTANDVPGGGFGEVDLQEAMMTQQQVTLGQGSYTVTLTGTVKDNSGTGSTSFDVTQQINIIGQGCGPQ